MPKDDMIITTGTVTMVMPDTKFKVQLENGHVITAYLSGRLRQKFIRIIEGDRVEVEISTYDLTKGRITYRNKA